jgi:hypothetical protein
MTILDTNFYTSLNSVSPKNKRKMRKVMKAYETTKYGAFLSSLTSVPQLSLDVPADACFLSDHAIVVGEKVRLNTCTVRTERK